MIKKLGICMILCTCSLVSVYAGENVILGGDSVGIAAKYDGVLVSGFYDIHQNGTSYNNKEVLEVNDLITKVGTTKINNLKEFQEQLQIQTNSNQVEVSYYRDNALTTSTIHCVSEQSFSCGLYMKDQVNGIGTITYYDEQENIYAALAHNIVIENNEYLQNGNIYSANIHSINIGNNDTVGSKNGMIDYNQDMGNLELNNEYGIYGELEVSVQGTQVETAGLDDIKVGEALIYTVIEGDVVESFSIDIQEIELNDEMQFIFKVTDTDLIDKCGGIIQGMSGSPIVQNNKLVGAVSHVAVNDPTRGYGVFIGNMLNTADSID